MTRSGPAVTASYICPSARVCTVAVHLFADVALSLSVQYLR